MSKRLYIALSFTLASALAATPSFAQPALPLTQQPAPTLPTAPSTPAPALSSTLTTPANAASQSKLPPTPIYTMAAASDAGINPALSASSPLPLTTSDISVDQAPEPLSPLSKWFHQYAGALKAGAFALFLVSTLLAFSARKKD